MHDLLLGPDSFVSSYFDRKVIEAMLADHDRHAAATRSCGSGL